jgi:hypothetical protein
MPLQLKLNEVAALTAYPNYSIKLWLYKDLTSAIMLERRSVFTKDLTRSGQRPVAKHNHASI